MPPLGVEFSPFPVKKIDFLGGYPFTKFHKILYSSVV